MSDDQAVQTVQVPEEIKQKFPELLELIFGSESMNDEERQYWINILPIMTPDQIENLKGILVNEKEQLAAIDAKYTEEVSLIGAVQMAQRQEKERRAKRKEMEEKERKDSAAETEEEEALLKQIENL